MSDALSVNKRLIIAIRSGRLEVVRTIVNSFGLHYFSGWSEGYVPLCDALKQNETEIAKFLLTANCNVNSKNNKFTDTPLHYAVMQNNIEIVEILLNRGADIDAKNRHGITALHIAIHTGKLNIAELLLNWNADVHAVNADGSTPLYFASQKGCSKLVKKLLDRGARPNYNPGSTYKGTFSGSYTSLHHAVIKGSEEIVILLLENNADVNSVTPNGMIPLHIAAERGYLQIAQCLLNHGASITSVCTSRGKEGFTPLHFAVGQKNVAVVQLFLSKGADVNAVAKNNSAPLHMALKTGHETYETVVKLLLEHGADVDAEDKDGKTALHLAVEKGCSMIVEDILKYSPDINNESNRSSLKTAINGYGEKYKGIVDSLLQYGYKVNPKEVNNYFWHTAVERGHLKCVEHLLDYDADVNKLCGGETLLHTAVVCKQREVAELLVKNGANVNAKNSDKHVPIFYAIENNDLNITKFLLANGAVIKNYPELLNTAVKKKCKEIVEILLQHDVDVNGSDEYGRTALFFTALNIKEGEWNYENSNMDVSEEITALLLIHGANVNAKNVNGATALHYASFSGYTTVVETLLKNNADVDSVMINEITQLHPRGRVDSFLINKIFSDRAFSIYGILDTRITALHIAILNNHEKIVEILLQYGAGCKQTDTMNVELHKAATKGFSEIVEILVMYGAEIDAKNENGYTALHIAAAKRHIKVINTLLEYGSDVNIIPNDKSRCEEIVRVLEKHIIKIKSLGLYICEEYVQLLNSTDEFVCFMNVCEAEIKIMKGKRIGNGSISLIDILKKPINQLASYAKNKKLVRDLSSDNYEMEFPTYASMIKSRFARAVKRNTLQEQANKFIQCLLEGFCELPDLCIENIFSYLNDNDLRMLICAYQPSVAHFFQHDSIKIPLSPSPSLHQPYKRL